MSVEREVQNRINNTLEREAQSRIHEMQEQLRSLSRWIKNPVKHLDEIERVTRKIESGALYVRITAICMEGKADGSED